MSRLEVRDRLLGAAATAVSALVIGGCAESIPAPDAVPPAERARASAGPALAATGACDAGNGGITLPAGFCATVFADSLGPARHIAVRDNGDVYVAMSGSGGAVAGLRDADGDGHAETRVRFGARGGNGIALLSQYLYVAENDRIVRYRLKTNALAPAQGAEAVVSGLPASGDHVSKTIVIASPTVMYVNIGSASNSCQVRNRALQSPGVDPCPELSTRAGVWRVDPGRTKQSASAMQRFATGLRNMVALSVDGAGTLYGVQMDRDNLYDNWPALFTAEDDAQIPAEEFVRIDQGSDFGWPYCYYDGIQGKKLLAPEYGGDRVAVGRCASARNPTLALPAHWAPISMLFYRGTLFPAAYRGGAFVAFHGDYFWGTRPRTGSPGYNVVFVPFSAPGMPSGGWQVFADGFAGPSATSRATAAYRPTGLAEGPDGALYVADDVRGRVWKVVYTGL